MRLRTHRRTGYRGGRSRPDRRRNVLLRRWNYAALLGEVARKNCAYRTHDVLQIVLTYTIIVAMNTGGYKLSPETCARMRTERKGKSRPPLSAEWRAKISASKLGKG